jgi:hypothetical protein
MDNTEHAHAHRLMFSRPSFNGFHGADNEWADLVDLAGYPGF